MRSTFTAIAVGVTCLTGSFAIAAEPDWSKVETKTLTLFYPGQSTYEWLRSPEHRRANQKVVQGEACVSCHEGEEAEIGDLIVKGERLEPSPIEGKNGSVEVKAQVAYDSENLYMRFQWPTQFDRPGQYHEYRRFDGQAWVPYGGHRTSSGVVKGEQPPLYEDRLAIMIDDGKVANFAAQGCWATCHSSMRDMPNAGSL